MPLGNVTVWTQAATAIVALLNATGSPATAWRARFEAVAQTETALNLFPTKINVTYSRANDSASIDAKFTVRGYVAATDNADLAADPLVLWAWYQVRRDPTLGGLVSDVRVEEIELGYVDRAASDQVCVDITICVEVEVGRGDPSVNMTRP